MTKNQRLGPNPSGFCMCGCGSVTTTATQTSTARGWVKGEPISYIRGHAPYVHAHYLDHINEEQRIGTCQLCGLVRIKRNGNSGWQCTRNHPDNVPLRHVLKDINQETRTAVCSICGSTTWRIANGRPNCATKRRELAKASRDRRTPEQTAQAKATMKAWNDTHKEESRNKFLLRTYGITAEDYDRILAEQDGGCGICGTKDPTPRRYFHVDHDHETGRVRGLLCGSHNTGLGLFGDDIALLEAAIVYLKANTPETEVPGVS